MSSFLMRFLSSLALFSIFIFTFFSIEPSYFLTLISIFFFISLYEMSMLLKLKKLEYFLYWFFTLILYILFIFNLYNLNFIFFISVLFCIFIAPRSVLKSNIILKSTKFLYGSIILLGLLISISHLFANDKFLLLISFIIVWISDIFAYFIGKLYGKTKLAPNVSPGKTVEGVYGAFFANFFLILILALGFDYSFLSLSLLCLIIIPLSILGDLFESLLKREASLKNSGNLIPGHGGVLDRIDGLCFTLPVISCLNLFGFTL